MSELTHLPNRTHHLPSQLVANIGIGTPPQTLSLQIDTGSSLFWVRSPKCRSESCTGKPVFDNTQSATYIPFQSKSNATIPVTSNKQTIIYGDNSSVECTLGMDTVLLGELLVENQAVCEAEVVKSTNGVTDGLIGLGPPGLRCKFSTDPSIISSYCGIVNTDLHNRDSNNRPPPNPPQNPHPSNPNCFLLVQPLPLLLLYLRRGNYLRLHRFYKIHR